MSTRRLMTALLILSLVLWVPGAGYAEKGSGGSDDSSSTSSGSSGGSDDSSGSSGSGSDDPATHDQFDDSGSDDGFMDDSIRAKLSDNPEYQSLLTQKRQISQQISDVEAQLKAAKDRNDTAAQSQLEAQLRSLKNQKDAVEAQMFQLGGQSLFAPFESGKTASETELSALKARRDSLEKELEQLRAALTAGTAGDTATTQARIRELEQQKDALQLEIRTKREAIRSSLRNLYTQNEWTNLGALISTLNSRQGTSALSPDSILISGQAVKFDAPPVIIQGRVLIPVRSVTTALGASVLWNDSEQKVTISRNGTSLEFEIGDDSMKVNGKSVHLDVPAQIVNGRTVVPLRALVEHLGLMAEWDDIGKIVDIQ